MGLMIGISAVWALLWSIAIPFAFKDTLGQGVLVTLVAWGPMCCLLWFAIHKPSTRERVHKQAMEKHAIAIGQGLEHSEGSSGIGLDPGNRILVVHEGGFARAYPFAQIRRWERKLASGSGRYQDQLNDAAASGMFIQTADVERPMWRVEMKDIATQQRWFEILTQHIDNDKVQP